MPRTVAGRSGPAPEASQEQPAVAVPNLPPQFSVAELSAEELKAFVPGDMPDMPDFNVETNGVVREDPPIRKGQPLHLPPEEDLRARLHAWPWDEISRETGLTEEKVLSEYGKKKAKDPTMLLRFLHGGFIGPILLNNRSPHQRKPAEFQTIKIRVWKDKSNMVHWDCESHPTTLMNYFKDGKQVFRKDGSPCRIWKRNPISNGSIIQFFNETIQINLEKKDSPDYPRSLELYVHGCLKNPYRVQFPSGYVGVGPLILNPFNKHYACWQDKLEIMKYLREYPYVYDQITGKEYKLSDKQIGQLPLNSDIKIKPEGGQLFCVRWSSFDGGVVRATEFGKAEREYLEKESRKESAKAQGRGEELELGSQIKQ